MKQIVVFIVVLFTLACSSVKNTNKTIENVKLPEKYSGYQVEERDNIFVLTRYSDVNLKFPETYLDLIVFDNNKKQEILCDQLRNGKLSWIDNIIFEVTYTPGNPEKAKTYKFYYNLQTQKKYNEKTNEY